MAKDFPLQETGFNRFGDLIGLRFTEVSEGFSRCVLQADERLFNPHDVLHGGVVYSLADTGMGAALYSMLAEEELCTTVEIKISYFRAVTSGTLVCNTRVVNKTRKIASMESEIREGSHLIARASGTFYISGADRSA